MGQRRKYWHSPGPEIILLVRKRAERFSQRYMLGFIRPLTEFGGNRIVENRLARTGEENVIHVQ